MTPMVRCPSNAEPPEIGDKFRFIPSAWFDFGGARKEWQGVELPTKVTGTIVYINTRGRFYRVAYETPEKVQYECFKF